MELRWYIKIGIWILLMVCTEAQAKKYYPDRKGVRVYKDLNFRFGNIKSYTDYTTINGEFYKKQIGDTLYILEGRLVSTRMLSDDLNIQYEDVLFIDSNETFSEYMKFFELKKFLIKGDSFFLYKNKNYLLQDSIESALKDYKAILKSRRNSYKDPINFFEDLPQRKKLKTLLQQYFSETREELFFILTKNEIKHSDSIQIYKYTDADLPYEVILRNAYLENSMLVKDIMLRSEKFYIKVFSLNQNMELVEYERDYRKLLRIEILPNTLKYIHEYTFQDSSTNTVMVRNYNSNFYSFPKANDLYIQQIGKKFVFKEEDETIKIPRHCFKYKNEKNQSQWNEFYRSNIKDYFENEKKLEAISASPYQNIFTRRKEKRLQRKRSNLYNPYITSTAYINSAWLAKLESDSVMIDYFKNVVNYGICGDDGWLRQELACRFLNHKEEYFRILKNFPMNEADEILRQLSWGCYNIGFMVGLEDNLISKSVREYYPLLLDDYRATHTDRKQ